MTPVIQAVAISSRGLPYWFLSLGLLAVSVLAQATAASERDPAAAGQQPSVPATKVMCGASIETAQGIHVDVDLSPWST